MTARPAHIAFGVVGLALGVVGVWALREATLSTHGRIDPSTQLELVVQARTEGGERGQVLEEMVEALLLTCRLEVTADIAGPIRRRGRRDSSAPCWSRASIRRTAASYEGASRTGRSITCWSTSSRSSPLS